jgi:hypothetical protein
VAHLLFPSLSSLYVCLLSPHFGILTRPVRQIFGIPQKVSIPNTAFSNGAGSFKTQMPLNATAKVLLSMSDATGFNSGGVTDVLTVGASQGGKCSGSAPALPFTYVTPNALVQCS